MSNRLVYLNGKFIPELEARISIFDSALMHGDMVFEITRSFMQKPYRLRDHLERLYASIRYAEIDCGFDIDEMEELTHGTIEKNLSALAKPKDGPFVGGELEAQHVRHKVNLIVLRNAIAAAQFDGYPRHIFECPRFDPQIGRQRDRCRQQRDRPRAGAPACRRATMGGLWRGCRLHPARRLNMVGRCHRTIIRSGSDDGALR